MIQKDEGFIIIIYILYMDQKESRKKIGRKIYFMTEIRFRWYLERENIDRVVMDFCINISCDMVIYIFGLVVNFLFFCYVCFYYYD